MSAGVNVQSVYAPIKAKAYACTCTNAKGLCMDTKATPPELPEVVPPYHRILWRDAQPTALGPHEVMAVKVPGKPTGCEVYLDAAGTPRCRHGFTASQLSEQRAQERVGAALQLQAWWRAIDAAARSSVRAELRRHQRGAAPSAEASAEEAAALQRAADGWRNAPRRTRVPRPCRCTTKGLRLERFGGACHRRSPSHQRKRKAAALLDRTGQTDDTANRRGSALCCHVAG